jgi:hypothetical protein
MARQIGSIVGPPGAQSGTAAVLLDIDFTEIGKIVDDAVGGASPETLRGRTASRCPRRRAGGSFARILPMQDPSPSAPVFTTFTIKATRPPRVQKTDGTAAYTLNLASVSRRLAIATLWPAPVLRESAHAPRAASR